MDSSRPWTDRPLAPNRGPRPARGAAALFAALGPAVALLAAPLAAQLQVPADFPTIQAAIDAAQPGEIVEVAPGAYLEALAFGGKTIVVRGSGGADVTTIDATGTGLPAVRIGAGSLEGTRLEGFTIQGGSASGAVPYGGGLRVQGSAVAVAGCDLVGNVAESGGGAAVRAGASVRFESCRFMGNLAAVDGGALHLDPDCTARLDDCTLSDNHAQRGGAVHGDEGALLEATLSRFFGNAASSSGGALSMHSADFELHDCELSRNSARRGGGLDVDALFSATGLLVGCRFTDNGAAAGDPTSAGGGLATDGFLELLAASCSFVGNRAARGGGAFVSTGSFDETNFDDCTFRWNQAEVSGGALYCEQSPSVVRVQFSTIADNQAVAGGGIFAEAFTEVTPTSVHLCGNVPDHVAGTLVDAVITTADDCVDWTNLGSALAGADGLPLLRGEGVLLPDAEVELRLTHAAPSATAALFVGLDEAPTPFKGGLLVPVPVLASLPLTTGADGVLALPFRWPANLPALFNLYVQFAVADAAAVSGVALSNGVQATTP